VEQQVVVGPLDGWLSLRRLGESTAAEAAEDPAGYRRSVETVQADGRLALTLTPYEMVRVGPA
jgi:hypothetical protein